MNRIKKCFSNVSVEKHSSFESIDSIDKLSQGSNPHGTSKDPFFVKQREDLLFYNIQAEGLKVL